MALLDQVLGGVLGGSQGGRGQTAGMSPVVKALLLALAAKAAQSYMAQRKAGGATATSPQGGGPLGGVLGDLLGGGGSGAGGGLGGLLAGLGGAGGLGALVETLTRGGQGEAVKSWTSTGANQPITPQDLGEALGADTVQELQAQTGLPQEQLLSELATELPEAVDQITPEGRLPTDEELGRLGT